MYRISRGVLFCLGCVYCAEKVLGVEWFWIRVLNKRDVFEKTDWS